MDVMFDRNIALEVEMVGLYSPTPPKGLILTSGKPKARSRINIHVA